MTRSPTPDPLVLGPLLKAIGKVIFAATMVAVGLEIHFRKLLQVGLKAMIVGLLSSSLLLITSYMLVTRLL